MKFEPRDWAYYGVLGPLILMYGFTAYQAHDLRGTVLFLALLIVYIGAGIVARKEWGLGRPRKR